MIKMGLRMLLLFFMLSLIAQGQGTPKMAAQHSGSRPARNKAGERDQAVAQSVNSWCSSQRTGNNNGGREQQYRECICLDKTIFKSKKSCLTLCRKKAFKNLSQCQKFKSNGGQGKNQISIPM
ncbi:hypothetical protein DPEC_G00144460 [Dallia pectoralis]|uniref:Uncharacterized protein n=1 Tax=Dallia pectoralis TaxID=75939 RepID=A0ACC2GP55_DALPE|nr:hypothetical protein DPEC_G00144460 [Dallia pectoralis]